MTDNDKDLSNMPATEGEPASQPVSASPAEEAKPAAPVPVTHNSGSSKLAGVSLVLALAALGGSAYLGYQWNQDKQFQTARLSQAIDEIVAERAGEFKDMQSLLQAQQSKFEELTGKLQAIQGEEAIQQKDAQSLRNGITALQNEIKSLQGDITTLKGEVEIQQGGVEIQKADTQNLLGSVRALQTDIQNLQGEYKDLQGEYKELNSRIDTLQLAQRNLLTTLENVKSVAGQGGDLNAFGLSEVEYLLHLADDKLKLQSDVASAINALQVAKARLEAIDEKVFSDVLKMIDDNLASLKEAMATLPDRPALAHDIFEMEQSLPALPLRTDVEIAELKQKVRPKLDAQGQAGPEESWWNQFGSVAWEQFKDIVTIRRERSSGPPLMAIEDEFFLYQNLRLELEAMRVALLAGDEASFEDASKIAVDWTQTYFDTENELVKAFLSELQTLQSIQLNPDVPDISNTLNAFLDVMERRQPVLSTNISNLSNIPSATPAPSNNESEEAAQ